MKTNSSPSIFNDVIGPVMRGPSSSHTAAAHRIGTFIRQLKEPVFTKVIVEFDRTGALATTYLGQGSAMGLAGGLLDIEMTDPEIINYEKHLKNSNFSIEYEINNIENKHPNAYQISIQYPDREDNHILAISTGGGMFEIIEVNGFKVSIKGDLFENLMFIPYITDEGLSELKRILGTNLSNAKFEILKCKAGKVLVNIKSGHSLRYHLSEIIGIDKYIAGNSEVSPVMPIISNFNTNLPFTTVDEMLKLGEKENISLSDLAIKYESVRSGLDPASILKKMEEIVIIIKNSIKEGLKGTYYEDRILVTQSKLILDAEQKGLIKKTINSSIIAYTSAIMEVKSSMGLIVAIPTAGSCGVVGGALFGSVADQDFDKENMVRAFLAAGITGVFIADKYTFSAEEGGCQVETGSGAAMAAAGLVEMNGGTAKQAIAAASMALQNELGLVCDPVAVRVEVPCLGKNIMAATNALNSSIMSIAGYDPVIPYDEVIDAMKSVGESLPSSLCCTGLGGLAQTPTGKCLYKKFNKIIKTEYY